MSVPNQMHEDDRSSTDRFAEEEARGNSPRLPRRSDDDSSEPAAAGQDWEQQARAEASRRRGSTTDDKSSEFIDNRRSTLAGSKSSETDEELFRRYQQGDQQAFLFIYERYKANIYAYIARILVSAGIEREQIDDTFQEVFLRLAQYQHTFTGGEFKAWIFTVTRHSCLSTKKKAIKRKIRNENFGDADNLDDNTITEVRIALSRTDDTLERLSQQEQVDLLLRAIAQLPETYREALIMNEYEGLTYDEIGKLTGTSLSTIRIRIFRAKARLRKMLLPIIGDQIDGLVPLTDPPIED